MLNQSYDVAIVGAGPAGTTLAREVARRGCSVIVLEKERLPRYKTCGGGVTVRAARLLDFDISPVVERVIDSGRFSFKMGQKVDRRYHEPICFMVMRDRFDHLLAEKAREAGVCVADGMRVAGVEANDDGCTIRLPDGSLHARIVVGADGANSIVALSLDLMRDASADIALEAEVAVSPETMREWHSRMGVDLGVVAGGYGWVFPKEEHLSIGVGGAKDQALSLKTYYDQYLASLDLGPYEVERFRGHHIPIRKDESPITKGPALLLGDAAGLADPLSREGIYNAIRSAQLAAPVVVRSLRSGSVDLSAYQRAVDEQMVPDLLAAATLLKVLAWTPDICFQVIQRFQRPWNAACLMFRGEMDWVRVIAKAGPFRRLLRAFA